MKNIKNYISFINEKHGIPECLKGQEKVIFFLVLNKLLNNEKEELIIPIEGIGNIQIICYHLKLDILNVNGLCYYDNTKKMYIIELKFNFLLINKIIDIFYKTVMHELLHLYEISNNYTYHNRTSLTWELGDVVQKIRKKYNVNITDYDNNNISLFLYKFYISFNNEINARVAEVYPILNKKFNGNNDVDLLKVLKETETWKLSEMLIKNNILLTEKEMLFSILNDIDVMIQNNIELKKKFDIYKPMKSIEDLPKKIDSYNNYFKIQGLKFQNKLIKMIKNFT